MSTSEGKGTAPMRMPAIRNSLMAYGHHQEFVQKDVMYLNRSTEELAKEDMFVRPVAESNTPSLETKLVYVDEEIVKLAWMWFAPPERSRNGNNGSSRTCYSCSRNRWAKCPRIPHT